jgi:hypothetical protein
MTRCFIFFILSLVGYKTIAQSEKPDVIIIYADDLGYGDLEQGASLALV